MSDTPPPPTYRPHGGGRLGWAALAGALAVAGLAASGWPQAAAGAAAGAAAVLAVALALLLLTPASPVEPQDTAPAPLAPPPFDEAFERLPDPVLIVQGGEPDDAASRRVVRANAQARALLRIPAQGSLLVAALRRPEVLEAVDEALYGRTVGTAAFDAPGAQDRAWRLTAAPLPLAEAGPPAPNAAAPEIFWALLHLRDETDVRRAERMRADFLANASHELRTPLASLSGFIETLRGHARDDAEARDRFLGIMAAQADRMTRLVADLLQLSRVELNEHVAPTGRVDLALAAADAADALQPQSQALGVRIEVSPPAGGGPVTVTGDRDQVLQVLANLIDNALRYSPRGGAVRVEVAADVAALAPRDPRPRQTLLTPDRRDEARYAALRVCDEGPGLAREELPRLTERFYRVAGQKGPGTGLGLSIVRHIVNRHRGGLAVESAPGAGSSFTVVLPLAPPRAREETAAAEPRHESVTSLS